MFTWISADVAICMKIALYRREYMVLHLLRLVYFDEHTGLFESIHTMPLHRYMAE